MKMPRKRESGRYVRIELNEEEREMLDRIKQKLNLTYDSEAIHHSLKIAFEYYFGERSRK